MVFKVYKRLHAYIFENGDLESMGILTQTLFVAQKDVFMLVGGALSQKKC